MRRLLIILLKAFKKKNQFLLTDALFHISNNTTLFLLVISYHNVYWSYSSNLPKQKSWEYHLYIVNESSASRAVQLVFSYIGTMMICHYFRNNNNMYYTTATKTANPRVLSLSLFFVHLINTHLLAHVITCYTYTYIYCIKYCTRGHGTPFFISPAGG